MQQQIDLLSVLPEDIKVKLSTVEILRWLCGLVTVLVIWWAWGVWTNRQLLAQERVLVTEQTALAEKLSNMISLQEKAKGDASERSVLKLAEQVRHQSKIIATLRQNESTNVEGFSSYLQAFSDLIPEGIWLKNIDIKLGGRFVKLEGKTKASPLVIQLIDQLNARHLTKDFYLVSINQPTVRGKYFSFVVMAGEDPDDR